MKLIELSIYNYRSIVKIEQAKIHSLQALIGENNAGKSNILGSIDVFLSAGTGGVEISDFNDPEIPIVIRGKFKVESKHLEKVWKPYLINNELILEKHIIAEKDQEKEKISIKNEYHGYQAEPKDWFLSIKSVKEKKGDRPKWKDIVIENNLPDYFIKEEKCTQADYLKGLAKYLQENEIEYNEPDLSKTQSLGLQSNVIANLPKFYLLKAQSNYSDETDKRSSTSTFRKLMSDLTDRIIKLDPKYKEIEDALKVVNGLLNNSGDKSEDSTRLTSLGTIEGKLKDILCNLMPTVEKVKLSVITDDIKTIFAKGVELTIDDGVETDVLLKGHGLQRCIVFSLLQALILNERKKLVDIDTDELSNPIILAIEEPELYIHPQLGKLFYDVLISFSNDDQVIYTTHSPRFIDVYNYESIAVIKKNRVSGTELRNCDTSQFKDLKDKKVFQGLTQLSSDVNELFFAKDVIVAEGPEDKIAITETCKKLNKITKRTEEIDVTIVVTGGKQSIPFFLRVLNAFKINYVVLHDEDIYQGMNVMEKGTNETINAKIKELAGENVVTFPIKLENSLGLEKGHLKDQYDALLFFNEPNNINGSLEKIVTDTLSKIGK